MTSALSLFPAFLGVLVVLQAGLNRKIAGQWGLPVAVGLNSLVLFMIAGFFLWFCAWRGDAVPESFRTHFSSQNFALWFLLPGLIGFALVVGGPWSIARWGAVYTFILFLSAQLATSLLWDWKVEGIEISKQRLLGVALAWVGVILACWKR